MSGTWISSPDGLEVWSAGLGAGCSWPLPPADSAAGAAAPPGAAAGAVQAVITSVNVTNNVHKVQSCFLIIHCPLSIQLVQDNSQRLTQALTGRNGVTGFLPWRAFGAVYVVLQFQLILRL